MEKMILMSVRKILENRTLIGYGHVKRTPADRWPEKTLKWTQSNERSWEGRPQNEKHV